MLSRQWLYSLPDSGINPHSAKRTIKAAGSQAIRGSRLREKLEGAGSAVIAADSAIEMEELQGVLASGRERGVVPAGSLHAAIEEAELGPEQTQDLYSYFEEHGIEVVEAE